MVRIMVDVKDVGKRLLRRTFELGQRVGVDVLPRHFYSDIPDIAALNRSTEWRSPRSMVGVQGTDLASQTRFLQSMLAGEVCERLSKRDVFAEAVRRNGAVGYGPIEAEMLYAFAAHFQPSRIVQVGAGVSTAVLLSAISDFGLSTELVCVDPFPTNFLVEADRRGQVRLHKTAAERVDLEVLVDIGGDGLLFVDSTHTVKAGGEVNRLILEVLPRLPSGSFAHFHDITFPYDYPPDLLSRRIFFWQETALLLAFLTQNSRASIVMSSSMLHHGAPEVLGAAFPRYLRREMRHGLEAGSGHFPSATYLRFAQ